MLTSQDQEKNQEIEEAEEEEALDEMIVEEVSKKLTLSSVRFDLFIKDSVFFVAKSVFL